MASAGKQRVRAFLGMSNCAIDAQRRIVMPKTWRLPTDDEETLFYLIPDSATSISIISSEDYELLAEMLRELPDASDEEADTRASAAALSQAVQLDKQGRFALTPELMEHAALTDKVIFVGSFINGRILSPENWSSQRTTSSAGAKYIQKARDKAQKLKHQLRS